MRKIGVIDIGTNSMRFMVCELQGKQIAKANKTLETTRLGQGVDGEGRIHPDAFGKNFKALKHFKKKAEQEQVEDLVVFGTSALRDAKNSSDFIHRVKSELGLSIRILSGQEEAEMGFKGAIQNPSGDALVIDIGGGSTELIFGNRHKGILDAHSLDIGALRMTEIYIKHHPVRTEEIAGMEEGIKGSLFPITTELSRKNISTVIGIGGTITTLSAIKQEMVYYDPEKIHLSLLTQRDVHRILEKLISLSLDERKKVPGLQPSRADIIIAGISILKCVMESLNICQLTVSESDNLEGMIYDYLEKHKR